MFCRNIISWLMDIVEVLLFWILCCLEVEFYFYLGWGIMCLNVFGVKSCLNFKIIMKMYVFGIKG